MKVQISKFSSHQTAKVFAILMAASFLLFMVPFALMTSLMPSPMGPDGRPVNVVFPFGMMIFIMPIIQGVFCYIMIRIGCWVYNKLFGKIGGIEFEFEEKNV